MDPIVIVGSGLAGWTSARELRKLDKDVPVTLITADEGDFYSKPMLSNGFALGKTAAQLINTPAHPMAGQLGVTLKQKLRILGIHPDRKALRTDAGDQNYGKLVLALGADPIRLPLAGDAAGDVLSVNDLADYARFRAAIAEAKHVAIIGAGLIGCEFANDLASAGFAVTVLDPMAFPLSALLPEAAGRSLIAPLAKAGVDWRFGRSVRAVDRAAGRYRLTLDDGSAVETDAVLSAVGLRPRTTLAKEAGLAVNRGIVADAHLRTSAPDIFALGDCAEIGQQVRPYVLPIMHAARALARTLAGEPTAVSFPPMPVIVKTPACPVVVQPVSRDAPGAWRILEDENGVKATFIDPADRMIGFVLTGARTNERAALVKLLGS